MDGGVLPRKPSRIVRWKFSFIRFVICVGVFSKLRHSLDRLRGNDLRRIDDGSGTFRNAYRIQTNQFGSDYRGKVVKVAKDARAVEANRAEFQTWMSVKGNQFESYFCPIVDRSGSFEFLVMDYVDVGNTGMDDADGLRSSLESELDVREVDFSGHSVLDIHSRNVGYHSRCGLVLIDYPWGANWKPA